MQGTFFDKNLFLMLFLLIVASLASTVSMESKDCKTPAKSGGFSILGIKPGVAWTDVVSRLTNVQMLDAVVSAEVEVQSTGNARNTCHLDMKVEDSLIESISVSAPFQSTIDFDEHPILRPNFTEQETIKALRPFKVQRKGNCLIARTNTQKLQIHLWKHGLSLVILSDVKPEVP